MVGIALHDRQAVRDGARDFGHVDLYASGVAASGAEEMFDQRAVAAAYV
jgi:hypothetical protein